MGFLMFDTFDGCSGAALATPAAVGSHTTFARRPACSHAAIGLSQRLSSVDHIMTLHDFIRQISEL